MGNYLDKVKEVDKLSNKYGIEFAVGDYVYLPLPFYNHSVWKIVKIYDESEIDQPGRLWVDQGSDDFRPEERHVRGFSIDNPFIKVDKECGEYLHGGDFYLREDGASRKWIKKND